VAAVDVCLVPAGAGEPVPDAVARLFGAPVPTGSEVADGAAWVHSDFQLSADGRGRWLVLDWRLKPGQRARLVQALIEIATYRVMAMLAFPVARRAGEQLAAHERLLSELTGRIAELGDPASDPRHVQAEERRALDELTRLAAEAERELAASSYRYAGSQAYWAYSVGEFLTRRLEPAMATAAAVERRQQQLSARVARASELLRTRVDVAREEQHLQLLAAMERRGKLSLRMQQTVEGLSVAALTYYLVGLVGYLGKPLKSLWPQLNPDWLTAAAVPLLALLVWRGVHRLRREWAGD
jgi:uncharacterized membrane-anchored protein